MEIPTLVIEHFYVEMAPGCLTTFGKCDSNTGLPNTQYKQIPIVYRFDHFG